MKFKLSAIRVCASEPFLVCQCTYFSTKLESEHRRGLSYVGSPGAITCTDSHTGLLWMQPENPMVGFVCFQQPHIFIQHRFWFCFTLILTLFPARLLPFPNIKLYTWVLEPKYNSDLYFSPMLSFIILVFFNFSGPSQIIILSQYTDYFQLKYKPSVLVPAGYHNKNTINWESYKQPCKLTLEQCEG